MLNFLRRCFVMRKWYEIVIDFIGDERDDLRTADGKIYQNLNFLLLKKLQKDRICINTPILPKKFIQSTFPFTKYFNKSVSHSIKPPKSNRKKNKVKEFTKSHLFHRNKAKNNFCLFTFLFRSFKRDEKEFFSSFQSQNLHFLFWILFKTSMCTVAVLGDS